MRSHARTIALSGSAATLAMLVLWIVATFWIIDFIGQRARLDLVQGTVQVLWADVPLGGAPGFYTRPSAEVRPIWWLVLGVMGAPPGVHRIGVPVWMFFLAAGVPTALAWRSVLRLRRRIAAGVCARCGYDRRGLAGSARCPECGAPVLKR
jgi:hypothetical protein